MTLAPFTVCESMAFISLTTAKTNSLNVVMRCSTSLAGSPEYDQITVTTGISILGKMSVGVVTIAVAPKTRIRMEATMKVYGRFSASRTIHILIPRLMSYVGCSLYRLPCLRSGAIPQSHSFGSVLSRLRSVAACRSGDARRPVESLIPITKQAPTQSIAKPEASLGQLPQRVRIERGSRSLKTVAAANGLSNICDAVDLYESPIGIRREPLITSVAKKSQQSSESVRTLERAGPHFARPHCLRDSTRKYSIASRFKVALAMHTT